VRKRSGQYLTGKREKALSYARESNASSLVFTPGDRRNSRKIS
jgi:hypothetical protein